MALFDVTDWLFVNILFTKADKILIKNLFELKDYNAKHLVREFPSTGWNVGTGQCLQVVATTTGTWSVDRRSGSGR